MKLESRFIRLPADLADEARLRAANERLHRPVDPSLGVLREEEIVPPKRTAAELMLAGEKDAAVDDLTCPKRPKWRYTMTKAEVEKNEGARARPQVIPADRSETADPACVNRGAFPDLARFDRYFDRPRRSRLTDLL